MNPGERVGEAPGKVSGQAPGRRGPRFIGCMSALGQRRTCAPTLPEVRIAPASGHWVSS
jgi:hypothetical protein